LFNWVIISFLLYLCLYTYIKYYPVTLVIKGLGIFTYLGRIYHHLNLGIGRRVFWGFARLFTSEI
jgi:hypothetical protein